MLKTDGHDKGNKAFFSPATVRTRLKRMTPFKIICHSLNCIFTGGKYDEIRVRKGRVLRERGKCASNVVPKITTVKFTRVRT